MWRLGIRFDRIGKWKWGIIKRRKSRGEIYYFVNDMNHIVVFKKYY